jgi:hypothetical protein
MYGCRVLNDPQASRLFPLMLSKINPYFSFTDCCFGVTKDKLSTARVALFNQLKTQSCIYTMESSFAGVDIGKDKGNHLSTSMLESLGKDICRTLLIHSQISVPSELS